MKTKSVFASISTTDLLLHFFLIVVVIINVFPILWMISSSIKLPNELFTSEIKLVPHFPTLDNFRYAIFEFRFFSWLYNSFITTLGISIGQVLVAILAAFGVCYFKTKYNEFVFYFLIATMVIPFQVTMIPNYILIGKMKLINTAMGVIIPNLAVASTFFFMRQHFKRVPSVLYEAALIEGAKSLWILRNVTMPLCSSAIFAMYILCVIDGWNLYFWPLLILTRPETRTLPIGLQQFLDNESGNRMGPFMATATLASVPIITLYFFIQRRIIEAFVSSGIKG